MTGTGKTVTRVDLCEAVYQKVGLSRTEASAFVELVLKEITHFLDKAPNVFRTISEVADDLAIPQPVVRFGETRFTQIKPMKRSGGRRYFRPDDVDLLKGIRRLLYGEGYTIRGVQRILKEHGIKSVQGIADQTSTVSFGAVEEAIGLSLQEPDDGEALGVHAADEEIDAAAK